MITFKKENNKYLLPDGTELPTEVLTKYPHFIRENQGIILINKAIGDMVYKFQSTLEMDIHSGLPKGRIKSFTIFGGVLCARFEDTNVPHQIDCLTRVLINS